MNYSKMLSPITINGCTIPNRFVVTAMVTDTCTEDGYATEQYIKYHEAKAKGGWGLIITEDYVVNKNAGGYKYLAGLYDEKQIPGHKKLTDTVHKYGTKIFCQIYHAGRQTNHFVNGGVQPMSASPTVCPWNREVARELSIDEIHQIVKDFGVCAGNAKKAGFDGIEIHAGNGYLIAGFMSYFENRRTDEYGGCFKNRMRFFTEVYTACREAVGPDFPIAVRFSADEHVPNGRDIMEARMIAKLMEELGVDLINCSNGVYGTYNKCQVSGAYEGHAWTTPNAEELKKVVNIPIIGCNSIDDPMMAESLVERGICDLVGMARCSLADPEMPNKAKEGREEEIRPCIRCLQGCIVDTVLNIPLECTMNPTLCREHEYTYENKPASKKVLVVGGGPAGLWAAVAAKRMGHDVTVWEKTGALGGQFISAAYAPGKGEYVNYLCFLVNEVKKLEINIVLNKEATEEDILAYNADKVIFATGAVPRIPTDVPGYDLPIISYPEDILLGRKQVEGNIVVIGAGEAGCECAMYNLDAERGFVTLVCKRPIIAHKANGIIRVSIEKFLKERDCNIILNSTLQRVEPDGVVLNTEEGSKFVPADAVIMAMGYEAYNPFAALIEKLGDKAVVVGDANGTHNVLKAGEQGFEAGYYA